MLAVVASTRVSGYPPLGRGYIVPGASYPASLWRTSRWDTAGRTAGAVSAAQLQRRPRVARNGCNDGPRLPQPPLSFYLGLPWDKGPGSSSGVPVIRGAMNPAISVWKRTRGTKDLRARRVAGQYEDNGDIDSQRIYLCGFTVTGSPRWLMRGGAPTCRIRRW